MLYFTLQIRMLVSANCLDRLFPEKGAPAVNRGSRSWHFMPEVCGWDIYGHSLPDHLACFVHIYILEIIGLRGTVIMTYYSLPIIIS